jgi:hypothetical protein
MGVPGVTIQLHTHGVWCRRDSLSFPAQPLSHCTHVIPVSLFEYKRIILSGVGYGIDTELHSHAYTKLLDST